jgi:hypothetical protein
MTTRRAAAEAAPATYPMTFEQEGLWLDDHLGAGPSRYLESWVYRLRGPLDPDAVEWAIAGVVDRHEALRSRLTIEDGRPVQIVTPGAGARLERRFCPEDGLAEELSQTVSQPLDLDVSPVRATLLRVAEDDAVLAIQFHHAVVDDWALAILDREFGELYAARVQNRAPDLEPLPVQLGEYALTQRAAGVAEHDLRYWRDRLRQAPAGGSVPPDRPRPAGFAHRGAQVRFRVGDDTGRLVRRLARARRTTPFTVLLAALFALLHQYNADGEDAASDLIIGTPVSRRGAASLDGIIGYLTDLLPLRAEVRDDESFTDLVASVRAALLEAMAHRDLPYTELLARAVPRKQRRGSPLCPVVLVVDDAPRVPLNLPGLRAERLYVHPGTCKFDICLTLVIDGHGYRGFLDYATSLYDPDTAERAAADFAALLHAAASDAGAPLTGLPPHTRQSSRPHAAQAPPNSPGPEGGA